MPYKAKGNNLCTKGVPYNNSPNKKRILDCNVIYDPLPNQLHLNVLVDKDVGI